LSVNDRSLVLRFDVPTEAGDRRALLTGDIQASAMRRLEPESIRAEIIELPHHGSAHETAVGFVGATGARVVLQSTGASRSGDPRWDSVREGRVWLETSAHASVWAEVRRDGSIRAGAG
jgi:competence protein ComEC